MAGDGEIRFVEAARLLHEVRDQGGPGTGAPVVMLHHGFGSVADWGDFPARLAARTGRRVVDYSRAGCGRSAKAGEPRGMDFVAVESRRLAALREALGLTDVVLLGHSDGGSIALEHAGAVGAAAVVAIAPHVVGETLTCDTAERIVRRLRIAGVAGALGRFHDDPEHALGEWARVWAVPQARKWDMLASLPPVRCPVFAIQGDADRCGTLAQLDLVARTIEGTCERHVLAGVGHDPFRECPEAILDLLADILRRVS